MISSVILDITHEFLHDRIDNEIYYSDLSYKLIIFTNIMKTKSNKYSYFLSDFSLTSFNDYLLLFILKANLSFHLVKHDSFHKLLLLC